MTEQEEFEFRHRYEQEQAAPASKEPPSTLDVALNAIPKGVANLLNAPVALKNLAMKGVASLPFAGHFPSLQQAAEPTDNYPMQAAEKLGVVDPAKNPQTGVQRVVDTAVQAGVGTVAGPGSLLKNVATGLASGAVGQTTKEVTGSDLLGVAAGVLTPFAISAVGAARTAPASATGHEVRNQTLKEAQGLGFVVQPSTVRQSFTTNRLESVAGKAAVAQDASLRNQDAANKIAARSIGLPEDAPLTLGTINKVREEAGKAYDDVENLMQQSRQSMAWFPRYHEKNLVEQLKQARADANAFYKQYDRNADPNTLKQAQAMESHAESIDRDMEHIATSLGQPELLNRLKAARQVYARTYDVERALNLGDGNVSLPIIGRMLDQGRPLSGELKIAGKFAQAFPRFSREAASVPSPYSSGTDAASSAMLGTAGYGAAGGPAGLVAAGLPLLRAPARNLVLSRRYQSGLLPAPTPPSTVSPLFQGAAVGNAMSMPTPFKQEY